MTCQLCQELRQDIQNSLRSPRGKSKRQRAYRLWAKALIEMHHDPSLNSKLCSPEYSKKFQRYQTELMHLALQD